MKILFVIHNLQVGGAEILVTNYLLKLKEMGHEVCLVQLWNINSFLKNELIDNGIPIYTLSFNCPINIINRIIRKILSVFKKNSYEKKLNNVISKLNPDVVHVHTGELLLDKINFQNLFYTFHTDVDRTLKYAQPSFRISLENKINNGLKIIALSEKLKAQVLDSFQNAEVTAISNGIDINAIKAKKINREQFLNSINVPKDAFILGHVGRFHPVKNHEKIISVFSAVLKKNPNSYLLLIGGADKKRLKDLVRLCNEKNVVDKTLFLGERKDATEIMSAFDCFILPSLREGFSLVLCEAQAHNIRAVATTEVPDEVIINDNCFKLNIDESDEKWAEYILGDFTEAHNKTIESVDINLAVKKHIALYEKGVRK